MKELKMTFVKPYVPVLHSNDEWKAAENKDNFLVTREDYNSNEGDYFISITTNNIETLRSELSRLSFYYAQPREGEFYFETRK